MKSSLHRYICDGANSKGDLCKIIKKYRKKEEEGKKKQEFSTLFSIVEFECLWSILNDMFFGQRKAQYCNPAS